MVAVESVQAGGHPRSTWVVPVQAVPAGAPAPAGWVPVYPVLAAPAPHHFWSKSKGYLLAAPAPVAGYYYGAAAPAPAPVAGYYYGYGAPAPAPAAPTPPAAPAPATASASSTSTATTSGTATAAARTETAPASAPTQNSSYAVSSAYTWVNGNWKLVVRRWNGTQWVEETSSSDKPATVTTTSNDGKTATAASPNASERGKLSEADQRDIVETLKKVVANRYDSSIADAIKRDALYPDAEDAYCAATKIDKDSLEKADTTAIENLVSLALGASPSTPATPPATPPGQAQTSTPAPAGYYPVNFFLPMAAPTHGHSLHHGQRYYTYPY